MPQARRRTKRPRGDGAPPRGPERKDPVPQGDEWSLARMAPPGAGRTAAPRSPVGAVTDGVEMAEIVLQFENAHAAELFGQFDQNLARIEQALGVDARARGNEVQIRGEATAVAQAQRALDHLYGLLKGGQALTMADVDGAVRMAGVPDDQMDLPTMESAKLSLAAISTRKKTIHARTPTQDGYMRAMTRSELVFGVGPAGTGKTYLAVAHAAMLLERGAVDRIVLTRPAVEAGERLGFLPGDMKEKVDPYLRPLYDALYDMIPGDKVERALAAGVIEIAPLAFMRGRTLSNAVVILDEAQNTTSMQMKMFLTRLGENAAMIVTGDPSQVDLPSGQRSGLIEALAILRGVEGVSVSRFSGKDVVRHPLVARIVAAYDREGEKRSRAQGHRASPEDRAPAGDRAPSERAPEASGDAH